LPSGSTPGASTSTTARTGFGTTGHAHSASG
jgi:hypothetical protein